MNKLVKESLLTSENLVNKAQFLKAKSILEGLFTEYAKMDLDSLIKYSILLSKVVNRLGSTKESLKKSESCLLKAYTSLISINKKPSLALITQIFQTLLNLSSIYSKQNKSQFSLSYLKKLAEISVPKKKPLKLAFLQSKVYLSLSTLYLDMRKPSDCLACANLALSHITEVVLVSNEVSSFEDLSVDILLKQKDKMVIYVLSNLNMAVSHMEISGRRDSAPYFSESLKFAEKLNDPNLLLAVQQNYSEFFSDTTKTGSYLATRRISSIDCPSSTFFGGNYYSRKKLKKAVECIETDQPFISTDEFFRKKIRSELGVDSLITQKLGITKNPIIENLEKKAISCMRHKKHQRSQTALGDANNFDRQIDNLHKQSEDKILKQKVKMQSKLRSKYYKNLIRGISISKKNFMKPPQRLFFKPPVESPCSKKRGFNKKTSYVLTDTCSSSRQKEIAKSEIENFMIKIHNDLKEKKRPEERPARESKLAFSAQKGLIQMREHMECIRRTLSDALLGKRRKYTAPSASFSSFLKLTSK